MNKTNLKKITLVSAMVGLSFVYYQAFIQAEDTLVSRLKGKILLQVEANGEAWYVYPPNEERYYMGRPDDAFLLMQKLGLGITNENLKKIPIAEISFAGPDSDSDGLSDLLEDAIGTDKNKMDTDGDSFDDKTELIGNYNASGNGKLPIDLAFSKIQAGLILLQVEQKGEAWYINPDDMHRYFLGRPQDAFNIMRKVGLGISNENLNKILVYSPPTTPSTPITVAASNNQRKYSENNYSFTYPGDWKLSKTDGKQENVFLRNYDDDIIKEKKAMIIVAHIKTDSAIDLDRYKTASKAGATKNASNIKEVGELQALQESYSNANLGSEETTTYLQLNDHEMLMITMFSAGNHTSHDAVLGKLLSSIEYK